VTPLAVRFTLEVPAHFLDLQTQRAGFVLLGAFLISFMFIRTSARLMRSPKVPWWPGSVTTGSGLHLHHLVWGIVLLLLTGFLGFVTNARSPWEEILAGLFGVGAGLTLDEFALWIHLRDVYWSEEGRSSFDAVVVAAVLGGLIVVGLAPFDLSHNDSSVETLILAIAVDVVLAAVAILKGKLMLGLIGIFIPFVSLAGAIRLASPGSWWGRRFYRPESKKRRRSEARWVRIRARRQRMSDLIAGAPEAPVAVEDGSGGQAAPLPARED
jgi:TctA family transporter